MRNIIRKTIKSKAGVTLVELIMVMAIMGILSVAISTLVTSATNAYGRSRTKIAVANIGYSVWYDMEERIKNSSELYISTSAIEPPSTCNSFYTAASAYEASRTVLYFRDASNLELYGSNSASVAAFYGDFKISLSFIPSKVNSSDENYTILTLIITCISISDGTVYTCEPYTFSLSNIKSTEDGILVNDFAGSGVAGYDKTYSSSYTYSYLYFYV